VDTGSMGSSVYLRLLRLETGRLSSVVISGQLKDPPPPQRAMTDADTSYMHDIL
jgi:hypothetical protein